MSDENEELIKVSTGGTISIPKEFRKQLGMERGDYVRVILAPDHIVIRLAVIT